MGKSLFFFIAIVLVGVFGCADRLPETTFPSQNYSFDFKSETATGFRRELGAYRLGVVVKRFSIPPGIPVVTEVTLGSVRSEKAAAPLRWEKLSFWPPEPFAPPQLRVAPKPEWFTVTERVGEVVFTFYPWRYDEARGERQFLGSAEVRLKQNRLLSVQTQTESGPILLTGEKMRPAAEALRALHQEWGFESEIVTVEEIRKAKTEPLAGVLPRDGTEAEKKKYFKNYDADLARRTVAYLRDRMAITRPRALVILGGADIVPPSHYLYFKARRRWLPTDLCYAGQADCGPGIPLGRLPFSSAKDWSAYLKKLKAWNRYAADGEPGLTSLAGAAFPGQVFIGEAAALHVADRLPWTWGDSPVDKRHRTRGQFNLPNARRALGGASLRPYVLHFDHGEGNEIYFDGARMSSLELRDATEEDWLPYVAMSMACANAAFDHALVTENLLKGIDRGDESIAEAMLASATGAIAYAGSIRRAMGDPDYAVDDGGNLSTSGGSYGVALLMAFAEGGAAATGPSEKRLGDVWAGAVQKYLSAMGNTPGDERHEWTWRNFVLLGDPLLPLPKGGRKRTGGWNAESVAHYVQRPPGIPSVEVENGPLRFQMNLTAESWRQLVRLTPLKTIGGSREKFPKGALKWELPGAGFEDGDRSLVRWENPQFPFEERQVWVQTNR